MVAGVPAPDVSLRAGGDGFIGGIPDLCPQFTVYVPVRSASSLAAQTARRARDDRPSLARMWDMCDSTVFSLITSASAILPVGESAGDQPDDLAFAPGQMAPTDGSWRAPLRRAAAHAIDRRSWLVPPASCPAAAAVWHRKGGPLAARRPSYGAQRMTRVTDSGGRQP